MNDSNTDKLLAQENPKELIIKNPWEALKQFTDARIALGRAGSGLPTREYLDFRLSHAQAKDAVWQDFNKEGIAKQLQDLKLDTLFIESMASNKQEYLTRPDLGRKLSEKSATELMIKAIPRADILIVIGDGLSSKAIHEHAIPFMRHFLPYIHDLGKRMYPVVIAQSTRVALGDEIGELLNAQIVVMLIGERPGLSSADSLGIYMTWQPCVGRLDAERNCISNVRPQGLVYPKAAFKLAWLVERAFAENHTGILLKDMSDNTDYHRMIKPK